MLNVLLYAIRNDHPWARAFRAGREAEAGDGWYQSQERGYVEQAVAGTFLRRRSKRKQGRDEDRLEARYS